jgi:uncharacterized protein YbaR (Trm112 family)
LYNTERLENQTGISANWILPLEENVAVAGRSHPDLLSAEVLAVLSIVRGWKRTSRPIGALAVASTWQSVRIQHAWGGKMHTWLIDILECPACHGKLGWNVTESRENHIETGVAKCRECAAVYPIREGIGLFLTPDLPRKDLWEQADNQLMQYLRAHRDLESRLMDVPVNALGSADLFYRALVLEEQGEHKQARALEKLAKEGIYTMEYRACWQSQVEYVIEQLARAKGPIVDLASGRCYLVEQMIQRLDRLVVATDFSPRVLRRDRAWLKVMGLYDQVSLLALDARRTPFRAGSVGTLTTNLGLQNVEEPGSLIRELRRVVDGRLLAISHFYPEGDETNAAALQERGLITFRREALGRLAWAEWKAKAVNVCHGQARPTPTSTLLEGARIDAFPVVDTTLEWCVIDAR